MKVLDDVVNNYLHLPNLQEIVFEESNSSEMSFGLILGDYIKLERIRKNHSITQQFILKNTNFSLFLIL